MMNDARLWDGITGPVQQAMDCLMTERSGKVAGT
jgi:hypothetical protein